MGLKFQTMTVPSTDPEMTCLRLGLKHEEVTPSLWPLKDLLRAGSATWPAAAGLAEAPPPIELCEALCPVFIALF